MNFTADTVFEEIAHKYTFLLFKEADFSYHCACICFCAYLYYTVYLYRLYNCFEKETKYS